jgi:hypothetical protein
LIDDYSRLERNKTTKRREQKTSPALVNTRRFVVFKRKLRTLNSSKLSTLLLLRPRKFLIDPSSFSIHNNDNYDKRTYVTIKNFMARKKETNKIPDLWKKKNSGSLSPKLSLICGKEFKISFSKLFLISGIPVLVFFFFFSFSR